MTRKEQLIQRCTILADPVDEATRENCMNYFSNFSEEDLQKEYEALVGKTDADERREFARREMVKLDLARFSGLANVDANDRELDKTFHVGSPFTVELFKSMIENNPEIRNRFIWKTQPFAAVKQARAARTQADKEAFLQAARELVASPSDANLNLACGVLGSGFSSYDIKAAVQSGQIRLLAANAEEQAEYYRQSVEAHQEMLRALREKGDIATLRLLAQQEAEANRRNVPQAQAEMNLEAIRERDSHRNYPPLPKGITKFQLQSATREYTTTLVQKYGKYQLLNRLMTEGE